MGFVCVANPCITQSVGGGALLQELHVSFSSTFTDVVVL
jgi:hypothetical protein